MIRRRTLLRPLSRAGRGIRSGQPSVVAVLPAGWGTGLVVEQGGRRAPVVAAHVHAAAGMTALRAPGVAVDLLEHLLAALVGCGVTDARIVVHGREVPILDGSSTGWLDGLELIEGPSVVPLVVTEPVSVAGFGGRATFEPSDTARVSVDVDFGPPWQGRAELTLYDGSFRATVGGARTFARRADVVALRAVGRAGGAGPENTALLGASGSLAPRDPQEPVRHKLLDAVGDLAWLGRPLRGAFHVERGSHRLHVAAVQALLRACAAHPSTSG